MKQFRLNFLVITALAMSSLSACDDNDSDKTGSCGNGTIELGEVCDPASALPVACSLYDSTKNWASGSAKCAADCKTATIGTCIESAGGTTAACGNGIVDAGEICDPLAAMAKTCADFDASKTWDSSGKPACSPTCSGLTIGTCREAGQTGSCGNGVVDAGEICDNNAAMTKTCADFDAAKQWQDGGMPACAADCMSLTQGTCAEIGSPSAVCGNGIVEAGEVCDDAAQMTKTCADFDATKQWQDGGKPGCAKGCTSLMQGTCMESSTPPSELCGNGTVENGEICDTKAKMTKTCEDYDGNKTWESGEPACAADCSRLTIGTCKEFKSTSTDPNILPTDVVTTQRCNMEKEDFEEICDGQVAHFCSEDGYVVERDCAKISTTENPLTCQIATETKEHGSFADCVAKCNSGFTPYNSCQGKYIATHLCEAVKGTTDKYEFIFTAESACPVACDGGQCVTSTAPKPGAECDNTFKPQCYGGKAYQCVNNKIKETACSGQTTCAMLFGGEPQCVQKCNASDVSSNQYACKTINGKPTKQNHLCLVANDSKYYWFDITETCKESCDQGECDVKIPTVGTTCDTSQDDICGHNIVYYCNTTTNKIDTMECGKGDFIAQPFCRYLDKTYAGCVTPCEEGSEPIMQCGGSNAKKTAYEDNYLCEKSIDGEFYYFNHEKSCPGDCTAGKCQ